MSLNRTFSKILKKELDAYAAWFPVTNNFSVGDYGYFEDNLFKRMGNIKDRFGIEFDIKDGAGSKIDFSSSGVKTFKLVGDAEVPAFPSGAVGAKAGLNISFSKENSFMIKADITSQEMDMIDLVAEKCARQANWDRRYKVVRIVYKAVNGVVIGAREAGTEVSLSGDVDLLKGIEAGKASAGIEFSSTKNSVFKSIGEEGGIGLALFRLRGDRAKFLGEGEKEEIDTDFGEEVENDF